MSAIPLAERGAHQQLTRRLLCDAVTDTRELPDGLAFRFPAEEYEALMHFIARERRCCLCLGVTESVVHPRVRGGACVLGSIYGFLQGAWPFGVVEAIWSLVAVHRWWRGRPSN